MGEKWVLVGKSSEVKVGDIVDGRVVKFVDTDKNVYVAERTLAVTKAAKPVEKKIGDGLFSNIMGTRPVVKSFTDARGEAYMPTSVQQPMVAVEFEFRDGMLRRVDPLIDLRSGRSDDALRTPDNRASSFPESARVVDRPVTADDDSVRPIAPPYRFEEPSESDLTASGTIKPNFLPDGMKEDMDREMFSAPGEQARVAVDDADAGDFDDDDTVDPFDALDTDRDAGQPMQSRTRRLGVGYVLKAARFDRRGKK
jgi:hypothetical protein